MKKHNNTQHNENNTNIAMNILSYILDSTLDELDHSETISEDQLWATVEAI